MLCVCGGGGGVCVCVGGGGGAVSKHLAVFAVCCLYAGVFRDEEIVDASNTTCIPLGTESTAAIPVIPHVYH